MKGLTDVERNAKHWSTKDLIFRLREEHADDMACWRGAEDALVELGQKGDVMFIIDLSRRNFNALVDEIERRLLNEVES